VGCHIVAMHLLLVSFCTPFPSHFPWPFTHNMHVCSRATHDHFKKKLSVRRGDVIYINIFPKNDIPFRDALPCFFGHNTWWESWERKKLLVVCANLSRVTVLNCYTIVEANHLQACQASFKIVDPHNTHSTYQRICV